MFFFHVAIFKAKVAGRQAGLVSIRGSLERIVRERKARPPETSLETTGSAAQ